MDTRKITPKQQSFCIHYVENGGNASAAYRAAYNCSKMKQESVWNAAHMLFKNSKVTVMVEVLLEEKRAAIKKNYQVDEERLTKGYARIAFANVKDLFDENGNLKKIQDLPDDIAMALQSVEFVTKSAGAGEVEHVTRIKLNDRLKALQDLGKSIDFFAKDNAGNKAQSNVVIVNETKLPDWMADIVPLDKVADE